MSLCAPSVVLYIYSTLYVRTVHQYETGNALTAKVNLHTCTVPCKPLKLKNEAMSVKQSPF